MRPTYMADKKHTQMIAHRGLSGIEPENTLGAFIAAGNRSYYGIETDVHRTADGKFVVIHDDDTGRVSDEKLKVEASSYAALRRVQLGKGKAGTVRIDRHIPSLEEYIAVCSTYEKTAILELKNHFVPEDVAKIVDIIRQAGHLDSTVFISFDYANMVTLRRLLPRQKLQYLCETYSDRLLEKLKQYSLDVDIEYTALTKERIDAFHREQITVNCWTVNDAATAQRLMDWGVDYITSNILE